MSLAMISWKWYAFFHRELVYARFSEKGYVMSTSELAGQHVKDEQGVAASPEKRPKASKQWQTPGLEDVSGKVMAQPYIRFT
jgi:hypothetical protein